MAKPARIRWIPFNLVCQAWLLGATVSSAQAFDRLNLLLSHVAAPGPSLDGVPGPPQPAPLAIHGASSVGVLGEALLFTDPVRHRVLSLRDDTVTVFAGTGEPGALIDPASALQTRLFKPGQLLVLEDQSVLVSRRVPSNAFQGGFQVLRIRTRPQPGQATVSVFAGNGQVHGPIVAGSALASPLGFIGAMAQERDGSVLLVEGFRRILRVRPDATIEVVASSTGIGTSQLAPGPGLRIQLSHPCAVTALADASILVSDRGNHQVLRIRSGAVTVQAGSGPGAEQPLSGRPGAISAHPDGSVWLVEHAGFAAYRLLRGTTTGVTLLGGNAPAQAGLDLDPRFVPGLGDQDEEGFSCLTSLADGSVILGSASLGLQLLSPLDALQERLEQLVEQGKTAVQAGDLAGFRQVELELAYLCAPSVRSFAAVNHAAHDQGRLEARKPADPDHGRPQAVPLVPVIKDLMLRHVHGYAERSLGELLRARLALRELRRYAEPLG